MKLSKKEREQLRMKFGGKCAYCACELPETRWHADHVEAVQRDGRFVATGNGLAKWKPNGILRRPENDHKENLFPTCVKCNILKSSAGVEEFRSSLTYFAHSIPTIRTYSHVHHLMRFGKLSINLEPVVFWFERYTAELEASA